MAHDHDDPVHNVSPGPSFNDIVAERLRAPTRRDLLRGGLGALGLLTGGGALLAACGDNAGRAAPDAGATPDGSAPDAAVPVPTRPTALGFAAVAKSLADRVTVPAGYRATVLYSLGDPIADGLAAYKNDGTEDPASFDRRSGDHHDGMQYFGLDGTGYGTGASDRGLLVMNHEAITGLFLHPRGQTSVAGVRTVADEVRREMFAHGVSVIQINRSAAGAWSYDAGSAFNRRIHTVTPMELSGPVRGADALKTKYSPTGTQTRGTVNNCANGHTPWGTYLTCEENWAGFFRRTADDDARRTAKERASFARYGVAGNGTHGWATVTPDTADDLFGRWNTMALGATAADDYRNVAHTFGWVVEIDPFTKTSVPRKRTALGRFAHEGAWPAAAVAGKPLVWYLGDDGRREHIYKFVSAAAWDPADATRTDRGAVGDKYLDRGTLYAARFDADGTGRWLELTLGKNNITAGYAPYAFADQADVLLNARHAADAAGATNMDRPEWGAVDPLDGSVYFSLTNNSEALRPLADTDAANPRHYNDPKGAAATPQYGNPNGHIIRWKEAAPDALTFTWDVYLFGANADADPTNVNLSGLTADNDFSSPDGLWFSPKTSILWIETDDGAYTDVTNCMLLAALPGQVGDGGARTVTNTNRAGETRQVATRVGAAPAGKLRRFLVGPADCEITGIAETPDGKALFVNIQHPGETTPVDQLATPLSTWPAQTAGARPRSSTLVITRDDGGVIGL
jgi:secreted PhoX family phosphatase